MDIPPIPIEWELENLKPEAMSDQAFKIYWASLSPAVRNADQKRVLPARKIHKPRHSWVTIGEYLAWKKAQ